MSAPMYDRILKASKTIADLGKSAALKTEHPAEVIQYRSWDKEESGG